MSLFNYVIIKYTEEHGLPEEREELLYTISDAIFEAENKVEAALSEIIRKTRKEDIRESYDEITGMLKVAKTLGLKTSEDQYHRGDWGQVLSSGGDYEFSTSFGNGDVGVRITDIPETKEVYWESYLNWDGGDIHTLASGIVAYEKASEEVRNCLSFGMDLIYENLAFSPAAEREELFENDEEEAQEEAIAAIEEAVRQTGELFK